MLYTFTYISIEIFKIIATFPNILISHQSVSGTGNNLEDWKQQKYMIA
jgi:hypothetical protein